MSSQYHSHSPHSSGSGNNSDNERGPLADSNGGQRSREERIALFLRAHTLTPLPAVLSAPGAAVPVDVPTFKRLSELFLFEPDVAAAALGGAHVVDAAMRHYGLQCWPAERLLPLMELYNALLVAGVAELAQGQALAHRIAAFYSADTAPAACMAAAHAAAPAPARPQPAFLAPPQAPLPPALPPHLAAFAAILMPTTAASMQSSPPMSPIASPSTAVDYYWGAQAARESPPASV